MDRNKIPAEHVSFRPLHAQSLFEDPMSRNTSVSGHPELKTAIIKWFYDRQIRIQVSGVRDIQTVPAKRIHNSAVIIKAFVTTTERLHAEFPLRYRISSRNNAR
jgi:hypothetical protein